MLVIMNKSTKISDGFILLRYLLLQLAAMTTQRIEFSFGIAFVSRPSKQDLWSYGTLNFPISYCLTGSLEI
jgi:hypothetical protein